MRRPVLVLLFGSVLLSTAAMAEPSTEGARVRIVWPHEGSVIKGGKFWLRMGLVNMGIAPAGVGISRHRPSPRDHRQRTASHERTNS